MKAGLGKAELELVASLTVPLYWIIREDSGVRARNGSAFFLDAGRGPFAVTAAHVLEGLEKAQASGAIVACQLGSDLTLDLAGKHGVIDRHDTMDIATFRITAEEVAALGKTVLTGHNKEWPPAPPEHDRGVTYCGFPGIGTVWVSTSEISFGAVPGAGIASSVSDTDISSLIEREHIMDVLGTGLPPENYDFGGMSGGPMLTVVEHNNLRSWRLAGVIYHGPNPSPYPDEAIAGLEIIKARRADFIKDDGTLDKDRWETLRPPRREQEKG
jgi:hypothetical protein